MVEGFLSIKKKTHNFLDQTRRSWPRSTPPSVAFDAAPMNSTDGGGKRGFLKRAKHRLLAPHSITCRKRGGGILCDAVLCMAADLRAVGEKRRATVTSTMGENAGDDSVVVTASFLFCIPTTENREEEKKSHSTTEERK